MDVDNATFVNGVDREPVLELIKILLDKGADPNVRTAETPPIRRFILPITGSLEWVDFVGMTPFHLCRPRGRRHGHETACWSMAPIRRSPHSAARQH